MKFMKWLRKPAEPAPANISETGLQPEDYPTLIVPTRNRPTSLGCLLEYTSTFYPGAKMVVADGSTAAFQVENQRICQEMSQISVDYRTFDPDLPLLSRVRAVLESLPEDHYVMGADDDFPILEVLAASKTFLRQNPDFSVCGGYNFQISMNRKGTTRTMMFNSRSIENARASERSRCYADLDFPTYYCVASRSHLLSRYDKIDSFFVVGFVDYMLGFHDVMRGKMRILDDISYIRTANSTHSYTRVTNRLNFLRNAADILDLNAQIARDLCASDTEMTEEAAEQLSEDFIFERIRFLTRDRAIPDPQTPESAAFHTLLKDAESAPAQAYVARMAYVEKQLKIIQSSDDNKGEAKRRVSLDG